MGFGGGGMSWKRNAMSGCFGESHCLPYTAYPPHTKRWPLGGVFKELTFTDRKVATKPLREKRSAVLYVTSLRWLRERPLIRVATGYHKAFLVLHKLVSKTFINTNVLIFRHRIASKTEKRYETSRNKLKRPFSSFVFWIYVKWNPLGPRRRLLDICFINTILLSTWAIYKSSLIAGRRAIGSFSILRRSAKCTRRPNLKAV